MKNYACAAFIFDGFADHELSLVMTALNRTGQFTLETFSTRGRTVTSGSGLRVMPHTSLSYVTPEDFDLLILPGGDQWEKGDNLEIFPLIEATAGHRLVLAVGSATLSLADLGLLDHIPHTGSHPGYFSRYCPEYAGAPFFSRQPCVIADGIITIDSAALVDPACTMLALFDTLQKITADNHELFDPAC
ncbi:DJ-1/PfpI family protein [Puia dinghuensis]|uniref:Glutamine amidotransferase n=1 Tax=Puia dinghuensis TaxID=1792502 RepID=A0A8J2XUU3_9BACT|nr:DJ-1/PfpI family protein [Puia dinghuensis]GGB08873.1 glutamine amidotransferase [Puia dinghuensis]